MNENFDQKIKQDATRVKNVVNNGIEDGLNNIDKVSKNLDHSAGKAEAWVNSSVSQLSNEFENATGDAKNTVAQATTKVIKNVGNGLGQFFGKAGDVAKNLPGGVGEKVREYPWIALPVALMAGFFLRGFVMPARNHRR